jgi:hypothetical protein
MKRIILGFIAGIILGGTATAGASSMVETPSRHAHQKSPCTRGASYTPTVEAAAIQRVWRQQHYLPWTPRTWQNTSPQRQLHFVTEAEFALWAACHPNQAARQLGTS